LSYESNATLVIETQALTKAYKQGEVVKSIYLKVPKHSIFGFLGPNGAGKSTTMRMLIGAIRPTRGSGKVFGLDIEKESDRIRECIGFLTQDTQFYPDFTPRETLRFCASFFPPMRSVRLEDRIQETLEFVGLQGKALHEFMARWNGKHPLPWDMFNTFNDASGQDYNWFFNNWFFGYNYLDLAVTSVQPIEGGYSLQVENLGGIAMPFDVNVVYADGSKASFRQNPGVWKESPQTATIQMNFPIAASYSSLD